MATTDIYTYRHSLSLHHARPFFFGIDAGDTVAADARETISEAEVETALDGEDDLVRGLVVIACEHPGAAGIVRAIDDGGDRKSKRLNSSHSCAPRMPSSP